MPDVAGMILLVEDNDDIRDVITYALTQHGHSVEVAHTGIAALQWLREHALPDLIILDLMMPEMDGFQFRERQLANPDWAGIPVIVYSGHDQAQVDVPKLGAVGYLGKPIDIERLLTMVARHDSPIPR